MSLLALSHLVGNEEVDLVPMVLIICQTLIGLRLGKARKTARNGVNGFTVNQQTNHIMNANPGAFDDRVTGSDAWQVGDISVRFRNHKSFLTMLIYDFVSKRQGSVGKRSDGRTVGWAAWR
jgi:hypothetical protein